MRAIDETLSAVACCWWVGRGHLCNQLIHRFGAELPRANCPLEVFLGILGVVNAFPGLFYEIRVVEAYQAVLPYLHMLHGSLAALPHPPRLYPYSVCREHEE